MRYACRVVDSNACKLGIGNLATNMKAPDIPIVDGLWTMPEDEPQYI